MKIIIIFIDLLMATVLFFVGRFFIKSRNTERCLPIRKHRGAREKRYSFGYAVFLILALMK